MLQALGINVKLTTSREPIPNIAYIVEKFRHVIEDPELVACLLQKKASIEILEDCIDIQLEVDSGLKLGLGISGINMLTIYLDFGTIDYRYLILLYPAALLLYNFDPDKVIFHSFFIFPSDIDKKIIIPALLGFDRVFWDAELMKKFLGNLYYKLLDCVNLFFKIVNYVLDSEFLIQIITDFIGMFKTSLRELIEQERRGVSIALLKYLMKKFGIDEDSRVLYVSLLFGGGEFVLVRVRGGVVAACLHCSTPFYWRFRAVSDEVFIERFTVPRLDEGGTC